MQGELLSQEKCLPGKQEVLRLILRTHIEKAKQNKTIQYSITENNAKQNLKSQAVICIICDLSTGKKETGK